MARQESDREDILREATALVERAEYKTDGQDEPLVVGFRRNGALTLFFGQDPVLQLTSQGRLRRAYTDGRLIKAEGGALVSLARDRSRGRSVLTRQPWDGRQQRAFLEDCRLRLEGVRRAIQSGQAKLQGCVPAGADLTARLLNFLEPLCQHPLQAADRPHAE